LKRDLAMPLLKTRREPGPNSGKDREYSLGLRAG
jgi:hypothetical protein